jgi:hypothetical protein
MIVDILVFYNRGGVVLAAIFILVSLACRFLWRFKTHLVKQWLKRLYLFQVTGSGFRIFYSCADFYLERPYLGRNVIIGNFVSRK